MRRQQDRKPQSTSMISRSRLTPVDQGRLTTRMAMGNQSFLSSLKCKSRSGVNNDAPTQSRTPVAAVEVAPDVLLWCAESYCPYDKTPIAPVPDALRKLQGPKLTTDSTNTMKQERAERRAIQEHLAAYQWPKYDPDKRWQDTQEQRDTLAKSELEASIDRCSRGMCDHGPRSVATARTTPVQERKRVRHQYPDTEEAQPSSSTLNQSSDDRVAATLSDEVQTTPKAYAVSVPAIF